MSFLSTLAYIVGGLFLTLLVALPVMMIIWYFKLKKVKKSVRQYFVDIQKKLKDVQATTKEKRDHTGLRPIEWREVKE